MLCLVDDAHWLDREWVETLAFVGHRLQADAIGTVFCTRTGMTPVLNELPAMEVGGLRTWTPGKYSRADSAPTRSPGWWPRLAGIR